MRLYTVHTRAGASPVLVREGFSAGALILGPLWLAAHRAWLPAVLCAAAWAIVLLMAPSGAATAILLAAIAVFTGAAGGDMRRFALELRGYTLVHVVAAADADGALSRVLAARPDLAGALAA